MNDPHVNALVYRIETGQQLAFNHPPALERENDSFFLRLADGQLRVTMKDHFPTEALARQEVDHYLPAWEIAAALQYGPGAMRFVFEKAEIIDRNLPPAGSPRITPATGVLRINLFDDAANLSDAAKLQIGLSTYIAPPDKFVASPVVLEMWRRYKTYREGREPITTMAYYCLTKFERTEAQATVSTNVLRKLHHLANVGTPETLRKRATGQEVRPHTPAEIAWMEAVVKRLIQRAGEWAANPAATLPKITLEDFPKL